MGRIEWRETDAVGSAVEAEVDGTRFRVELSAGEPESHPWRLLEDGQDSGFVFTSRGSATSYLETYLIEEGFLPE